MILGSSDKLIAMRMSVLKQRVIIVLIVLMFAFLVLLQWKAPSVGIMPRSMTRNVPVQENPTAPTTLPPMTTPPGPPIVVLAWFPLHNWVEWDRMDPPLFNKCPPDLNCVVTSDRQRFNESSAVIIHMWHHPYTFNLTLRPDQYLVFAMWESPANDWVDFSMPEDSFNLTMSYRTDSDVFWPYGGFRERQTPANQSELDGIQAQIRNKTKLVSWVVSECNKWSGRVEYVKELQKYIPVDIYGKCGTLNCSIDPNRNPTALATKTKKPCDRILNNYKFYLSLENSICRDYITEKFFERMDNLVTVPIVFERKLVLDTASDEITRRALNRSFIAADDFRSPRELADYLRYLDKNEAAYAKYLEWREEFEVALEEELRPGCKLCRILKERKKKVIENIKDWWVKDAGCHRFKQAPPK